MAENLEIVKGTSLWSDAWKRLKRNRELFKTNVISAVELEEMEDEAVYLAARRKMLKATLKKDSAYQNLQQQQMTSSLDLMQRNLGITKQSLGRVVKDLSAKGLIAQTVGTDDRRERRLTLTDKGQALEHVLTAPQRALMANAYRAAGAEAVAGFRTVLGGLRKR